MGRLYAQGTAQKTVIVARALGPARTSSDLLPYIAEEVERCPDDELLACLAAELGNLRDVVAAKTDLLPTLEGLCKADETLVRQAAVESLRHIGSGMNADEINAGMAPLVKRLLAEAWWTSKVSAAGLLATAYPLAAAETQAELKGALPAITKDETPMVRRSVATNLGALCAALEPDCVLRDLFPSFNKLANDDQDSVRILTFGSCVQMCTSQPAAQCTEFIHPAIDNFGKDSSWRVRLEVAKALDALVEAIPGDLPVTICCNLLQDPELDVRRFALEQVPGVLTANPGVAESSGILAAVAELADVAFDEAPNALMAKTTLAQQTLKLSTIVGPELTTSTLVPIVGQLIQEEAVEVRIAILEGWTELVKTAGGAAVIKAVPLSMLAEDQSWRVRRSVLSAFPLIAGELTRSDFDTEILPLLTDLAQDQIGSVREMAMQVLVDLVAALGDDFTTGKSLPLLVKLAGTQIFDFRITACQVRAERFFGLFHNDNIFQWPFGPNNILFALR
jgi:serine/threonine-protein phosphatase 2A regulatory subunit A